MEEFKKYPFIMSAEIQCGGLFGRTKKQSFEIDRQYGKIPARIIVQQFEMKVLDKQGIRRMIVDLENKVEELKVQLAGLEYGN